MTATANTREPLWGFAQSEIGFMQRAFCEADYAQLVVLGETRQFADFAAERVESCDLLCPTCGLRYVGHCHVGGVMSPYLMTSEQATAFEEKQAALLSATDYGLQDTTH